MPALLPPEVTMDPQWQQQIEKDLKVCFILNTGHGMNSRAGKPGLQFKKSQSS